MADLACNAMLDAARVKIGHVVGVAAAAAGEKTQEIDTTVQPAAASARRTLLFCASAIR